MTKLIIRRFLASEKKQIKDFYELASVHSEIGYRSGPWEADFEDIDRVYVDTGGDFLVGIIDEKIVAMVGLLRKSDHIAHIRRMRVHPDYRRKGYAGEILRKIEEIAKENGVKELQLKTSTQQKMAQNFYEKNGYVKLEKEKEYYTEGGGNAFEVVWYRKILE